MFAFGGFDVPTEASVAIGAHVLGVMLAVGVRAPGNLHRLRAAAVLLT